jgi:tetratricopeptide (TPR) repeat protein
MTLNIALVLFMNCFGKYLCSLVAILIFFLGQTSAMAALSQPQTSAINLLNSGVKNLQNGHYEAAIDDFTEVIRSQPELVPQAYSNRCLAYLQLQQYPNAIEDCTQAIQFNPSNTEAYLNLGLVYYRQGNYPKAIAIYESAIEQNLADWRFYYNLGLAYGELKNYDAAITNYNVALKQNALEPQQTGQIYNDRGLSYLLSGRVTNAIADFTRSIDTNTDNQFAYYNRACAYHRQQSYLAAIADFTQAIQLNPSNINVYVNRGWLYHQIGQNHLALADLRFASKEFKQQGNLKAYRQAIAMIRQLQPKDEIV